MNYVLRTPKGIIGLVLVAIVFLMAVGSDLISPYDPLASNLNLRNKPPGYADTLGQYFILGTDPLGRDNLSRIIYGARISVLVSVSAVVISGTIGCFLGMLAGFLGGVTEAIVMRVVDVQLAVPMILLAIAWLAFVGPGILGIVIIIAIWGWVQYARLARGMTLSLKEVEFVLAARAVGVPTTRIVFVHILPNLLGTLVVMATLQLGQAVLLEAALSFLGVGVQPPTPTWGSMLADGRAYIDTAWWIATFPGFAIATFVLGANLLGDTLRDALDPRVNKLVPQ